MGMATSKALSISLGSEILEISLEQFSSVAIEASTSPINTRMAFWSTGGLLAETNRSFIPMKPIQREVNALERLEEDMVAKGRNGDGTGERGRGCLLKISIKSIFSLRKKNNKRTPRQNKLTSSFTYSVILREQVTYVTMFLIIPTTGMIMSTTMNFTHFNM
jgi:hypothetical protein